MSCHLLRDKVGRIPVIRPPRKGVNNQTNNQKEMRNRRIKRGSATRKRRRSRGFGCRPLAKDNLSGSKKSSEVFTRCRVIIPGSNAERNSSVSRQLPFCRCVRAICFFFFSCHKYLTRARKLQYAENQWPAYQHALLCIIHLLRMLLSPVMVVSLVHLGPDLESPHDLRSLERRQKFKPRQFRHCLTVYTHYYPQKYSLRQPPPPQKKTQLYDSAKSKDLKFDLIYKKILIMLNKYH